MISGHPNQDKKHHFWFIYQSLNFLWYGKCESQENIVSKAQSPQEAETNLVKAACDKGLQDDYGVVVIFT